MVINLGNVKLYKNLLLIPNRVRFKGQLTVHLRTDSLYELFCVHILEIIQFFFYLFLFASAPFEQEMGARTGPPIRKQYTSNRRKPAAKS